MQPMAALRAPALCRTAALLFVSASLSPNIAAAESFATVTHLRPRKNHSKVALGKHAHGGERAVPAAPHALKWAIARAMRSTASAHATSSSHAASHVRSAAPIAKLGADTVQPTTLKARHAAKEATPLAQARTRNPPKQLQAVRGGKAVSHSADHHGIKNAEARRELNEKARAGPQLNNVKVSSPAMQANSQKKGKALGAVPAKPAARGVTSPSEDKMTASAVPAATSSQHREDAASPKGAQQASAGPAEALNEEAQEVRSEQAIIMNLEKALQDDMALLRGAGALQHDSRSRQSQAVADREVAETKQLMKETAIMLRDSRRGAEETARAALRDAKAAEAAAGELANAASTQLRFLRREQQAAAAVKSKMAPAASTATTQTNAARSAGVTGPVASSGTSAAVSPPTGKTATQANADDSGDLEDDGEDDDDDGK